MRTLNIQLPKVKIALCYVLLVFIFLYRTCHATPTLPQKCGDAVSADGTGHSFLSCNDAISEASVNAGNEQSQVIQECQRVCVGGQVTWTKTGYLPSFNTCRSGLEYSYTIIHVGICQGAVPGVFVPGVLGAGSRMQDDNSPLPQSTEPGPGE